MSYSAISTIFVRLVSVSECVSDQIVNIFVPCHHFFIISWIYSKVKVKHVKRYTLTFGKISDKLVAELELDPVTGGLYSFFEF